ncbi:MAG: spore germination protein [Clostridia bacterium]|nr:spore germination protein [Clostridia bacterium]
MSYDMELKHRTIDIKGEYIHLFFMDSLTDADALSEFITDNLISAKNMPKNYDELMETTVAGATCELLHNIDEIKLKYLTGYTVVFLDGKNKATKPYSSVRYYSKKTMPVRAITAVVVDTQKIQTRAVVEPPTSSVIKGPREGFVESFKINLSLIRKRLRTDAFTIKLLEVGRHTKTTVCVCYLKDIAKQKVVNEVVKIINSIDMDGILDSSYVAKFLDNRKNTLFKMVGSCEKPDIVTSKLLEGRVAVIVDGSPIVLTVPYLFIEDLQAPDDYYDAPEIGSFLRIIRLISVVSSIIIPGIYVSLQLYNYQIIPLKFLITIINSTKNISLAPLAEMILVLLLFDLLRESNTRMPRFAGLSLSVVGAVVLGDAAVKAGLLGAPAVVIGAMSGIGLYAMPDNTVLFTLLRLLVTIIGGIAGLFGIMILTLFILSYLISLQSFNTPYFAPFAPSIPHDRQDAVIKKPLSQMNKRPYCLQLKNVTRKK